MNPLFDISDLSPRNRAIFLAGVSGGDGEGDAAPAPDATEATDAPPVEGEVTPEPSATADAPPAGDAIPDLPTDLAVADVEVLQALHGQYGQIRDGLRESARSKADLDKIAEVTQRRSTIAQELQRRIDENREVQEALSALDAEIAEEVGLPEPEMALASATPRQPTAAMVAAARGEQSAAGQSPEAERRVTPMLASMTVEGVSAGSAVDVLTIGQMLDRTKKGAGRAIVASLAPYEESLGEGDILSNRHGAERNTELMREAQEAWRLRQSGQMARAAAICEPLDIIRAIPDAFSTAEPVREIFPSRAAGRLGFTFMQSVALADLLSAVSYWDEDDQAAVDPDDSATWKECLDVDCGTPEEIKADAIVACLRYDITTEMSSPERIQNLMNALMAVKARKKEATILRRIDNLSHRYQFASSYGAVPALITALNTAMAQVTYANRIQDPNYTVILPPGLVHLLTIDLAGRGYDAGDVTDGLAYVKDRVPGISAIVQALDASETGEPGLPFPALNPTSAGAVTLPSLDGDHRVRILDPGAAIYAETGEMNVGTMRDANLLRMNKTQYFAEEFLMLAKNGPQPWLLLDLTLCADGARAGLIEPVGCAS